MLISLLSVVNHNKEGHTKCSFVDFRGNDHASANFGEYGVHDSSLVGFDGETGIEDDTINRGPSKKKKQASDELVMWAHFVGDDVGVGVGCHYGKRGVSYTRLGGRC